MDYPFDDPFDYTEIKDGKIIITRSGKTVKILGVKDSVRFIRRTSGKPEHDIQIELARVTGNYKRGNER